MSPFHRFAPLALALAAALDVAPLFAEARADLSVGATAASLSLHLSDPTNSTWRLQTSTDLATWTDRATFRVSNTDHRFAVNNSASLPRVFFRFQGDVEGAALSQTLATATTLPAVPDNYARLDLPAHLNTPFIAGQDNTPADNPVTDTGATLGRVLFYDKRLSANHTVSCASCHQAEHGFSDPRPLSVGFDGGLTDRNSMGLTSARYYPREHFFWDERAATLEDQVLMPIQNEVEMGLTLAELVARVSAEPYYAELFTQAFGDATVTTDRISRALAQFVRSIVSSETKYDRGVALGFTNFTAQENLGRRLFLGQVGAATCNACHGTDNFVPANIENNGLENPLVDLGVGGVTGRPADLGKFKVPTLRNIELTAPYMHDGRFATLEEVIEFYDSGVTATPNLGRPLRAANGQPRRLNLSADEKSALLAFLKTLTDTSVTTDPRFGDPFRSTGELVLP